MAVHLGVGQQSQLLELVGVEQVCLVQDEHDGAPALVVFGGEQVHGLRDQRRLVEPLDAAERGDDAGVEAAPADGGVAEVDDRVQRGVEGGERRPDRDGLAGADLAGDHAQSSFGDVPADAGNGLGVRAVSSAAAVLAAVAKSDQIPPVFAGLTSATTCVPGPISPGQSVSYTLIWDPASDNTTPPKKIDYEIYQAGKPGGEDYTAPTYVTAAGATRFTTPALPGGCPALR